MNSSKGFSATEMDALSVWSLPVAGQTQTNDPPWQQNKQPAASHLKVADIEAMQKQAYEEAFAQGKADGFQQGYNEGYDEGRKKGYEDNAELLTSKAGEFSELMAALSEPFKALDEEVEKELVKLSIGIASQIIRRELKIDSGQVVAAVREAMSVLPLSSQKISLHLHPDDAELVRSVLSLDAPSSAWAIVEDPLITPGGCKVNTDISHIDASIENRLAAVVATVFGNQREQRGRT